MKKTVTPNPPQAGEEPAVTPIAPVQHGNKQSGHKKFLLTAERLTTDA